MRLNLNTLKRGLVTGIAGLLISSAPGALAASGAAGSTPNDDERPEITLHGTAYDGWQLVTTGQVLVDGRFAATSDRIDNGTRVVVSDRSTARAEIPGVGSLAIAPKSELVIDLVDDTVVAHMRQGTIRVEVNPEFGAFVETPDSRVVAHPGTRASFRVTTSPLGTSFDRSLGAVEMSAADHDGDWDIDSHDMSDHVETKARHKEKVEVKVKKDGHEVNNQPVNFAITGAIDGATGSFEDGAQRVTVDTDSDGVASVEVEVGASAGYINVEASIPGTDAHETFRIDVETKKPTVWNKYTTTLYVAMGAGVVAGTTLAIMNKGETNQSPSITPEPPVISVP